MALKWKDKGTKYVSVQYDNKTQQESRTAWRLHTKNYKEVICCNRGMLSDSQLCLRQYQTLQSQEFLCSLRVKHEQGNYHTKVCSQCLLSMDQLQGPQLLACWCLVSKHSLAAEIFAARHCASVVRSWNSGESQFTLSIRGRSCSPKRAGSTLEKISSHKYRGNQMACQEQDIPLAHQTELRFRHALAQPEYINVPHVKCSRKNKEVKTNPIFFSS